MVVDEAARDRFDAQAIRAGLEASAGALLRELTVLEEADSTNSVLLRISPERRHAHAVLADSQLHGRGRRQRAWLSPPGGNVYFSLGWQFPAQSPALSTLPLAVAVCLARCLEDLGLDGFGLKWPNDVLVRGAKLAGILVESQSQGTGPVLVVIGIGINVRMPSGIPRRVIDRPWTDLVSSLPPERRGVSRGEVVAGLLNKLLPALERFGAEGFEPFREDWLRFDLLRGRRVRLEGNGGFRTGTALDIDESGGLLVDIEGYGPQVLHAAEVSIADA